MAVLGSADTGMAVFLSSTGDVEKSVEVLAAFRIVNSAKSSTDFFDNFLCTFFEQHDFSHHNYSDRLALQVLNCPECPTACGRLELKQTKLRLEQPSQQEGMKNASSP